MNDTVSLSPPNSPVKKSNREKSNVPDNEELPTLEDELQPKIKGSVRRTNENTDQSSLPIPPHPKSIRGYLDSLLDSITFGIIMTLATIFSLFGVDVRYTLPSALDTDYVFLSLTAVVLILFSIEITLRAIIRDDYLPLPAILTGNFPPYKLPESLIDTSIVSTTSSSSYLPTTDASIPAPKPVTSTNNTIALSDSSTVSVNCTLYSTTSSMGSDRKDDVVDSNSNPTKQNPTTINSLISVWSTTTSSETRWIQLKRKIGIYLYNIYYFLSLFRCGSFYFWLDLVATISMGLDIPIILFDMQDEYNESFDEDSATEISIARGGRASRAGARTGRLLRLIAIVRLLRITRLSRPLTQTFPPILEWATSSSNSKLSTKNEIPSVTKSSTSSSDALHSVSSSNNTTVSSSMVSKSLFTNHRRICCGNNIYCNKVIIKPSQYLRYYLFTVPLHYAAQFREQFEIARIALSRETRVGAKLTSLMTQRIIVGVLLLIIAIPLLTYHSTDTTLNYSITQAHGLAVNAAIAEHNYLITGTVPSSSSTTNSTPLYAAAARDRAIGWLFQTHSSILLGIRFNDTWLRVPLEYNNFNNTYLPPSLSSAVNNINYSSTNSSNILLPSWTKYSIYQYDNEPPVHGYLRSSDVYTIDIIASVLVYRNQTLQIMNYDRESSYLSLLNPSYYNQSGEIIGVQYWTTQTIVYYFSLRQRDAAWGTGLTLFIIVILAVGAALFSYDTNRLVLRPLEKMVEVVRRISVNPLATAYQVLNNQFQPSSGTGITTTSQHNRKILGTLLSSQRQSHLFDTKYLFHSNKNVHGESTHSSTHNVSSSSTGYDESFLQHVISSQKNKLRSARAKALEIDEGEALETRLLLRTLLNMGSLLKVGFGEQGANIITNNMNTVQELNPVNPGTQKYAIIVRIGVSTELLTKLTITLGEEMVLVLNTIANAIHRTVSLHNGIILGQDNNASSFLIAWPLIINTKTSSINDQTHVTEYGSGTGITNEVSSSTKTDDISTVPVVTAWSRTADIALQCVLRCYVAIGRDCSSILANPNEIPIEPFTGKLPVINPSNSPSSSSVSTGGSSSSSSSFSTAAAAVHYNHSINRYIFISDNNRQRLFAVLPNIRTEISCYLTTVLHAGWAIEGPLGSDRKIDATMTGPHIELTKRLLDVGYSYYSNGRAAFLKSKDTISQTKEYMEYLQKSMEHIPGTKEMISSLLYASSDSSTVQRPLVLFTHPFFALLTPEGQAVCRRVDRIWYQKRGDLAILSTYEPWTVYTSPVNRAHDDDAERRPIYRPETDLQSPSVVPVISPSVPNVTSTVASNVTTTTNPGKTSSTTLSSKTVGSKRTVSNKSKDANGNQAQSSSKPSTKTKRVSNKSTVHSSTVNTANNTVKNLLSSSITTSTTYQYAYKRLTDNMLRPRTVKELETVQEQLLRHETSFCYDYAIDLFGYDVDPRVLRLLAGEMKAIALTLRPVGENNNNSLPVEGSRTFHQASSFIIRTDSDKFIADSSFPFPTSSVSTTNTGPSVPNQSLLPVLSGTGLFDRFDLTNLRKLSSSTKTLFGSTSNSTTVNRNVGGTHNGNIPTTANSLPTPLSPLDSPKRTLQEQKQLILPPLSLGVPSILLSESSSSNPSTVKTNSIVSPINSSESSSATTETLSISARTLLETPSYPQDLSSILALEPSSLPSVYPRNIWRTDILLRALRRHALPAFRTRMNAGISILYGIMNSINCDIVYGKNTDGTIIMSSTTTADNIDSTTATGTTTVSSLLPLALLRAVEEEEQLWIHRSISNNIPSPARDSSLSSLTPSSLVPTSITIPYDLQNAIRFLLYCYSTTGDDSIVTVLINIGKYIYTYYHTSIPERNKEGPVWPLPARRFG